jgi:hypothetical protein
LSIWANWTLSSYLFLSTVVASLAFLLKSFHVNHNS